MVYLDNNSTTMVAQEVIEAMLPYYSEIYGNPSSIMHQYGNRALFDVEEVKMKIAKYFCATSDYEFIFTSGSTETNNIALKGLIGGMKRNSYHIITTAIEHKSILEVCKELGEKNTISCTILPVDKYGHISIDELEHAIRDDTILISVMGANNEIGVINPLKEIGAIAKKHGIFFHSDLTQLIGDIKIDINDYKLDMFSFSAHKIHGPKGIGCLYLNKRTKHLIKPIILGGNQQTGIRSGTLNVPGIIGLGKAIDLLNHGIACYNNQIKQLRNLLLRELTYYLPVVVNGDLQNRIANNLNVIMPQMTSIYLASNLPDIAFSTGSACLGEESSYVLKALGLSSREIECSVRFGLSRYTTEEEILYVIEKIKKLV